MTMMRHSKMQLQVLSLYRQFLRAARDKPGAVEHVRQEFRKNSSIPRTDTILIEHNIRRAERQLKILTNPSFKSMGVFLQPERGGGGDSTATASITDTSWEHSSGAFTSTSEANKLKDTSATVAQTIELGHKELHVDTVTKPSVSEDLIKR